MENINIVDGLIRRRLREEKFSEGMFEFEFSKHSTARHLKIHLVHPVHDERLLVFQFDDWISSAYYFNNRNTLQGYFDGPWVDELKEIMQKLHAELKDKISEESLEKFNEEMRVGVIEAEKLERFKDIYRKEKTQ